MLGPGEAGCFRQVAALYSDYYRQVPLYIKYLDQGRLAALLRQVAALYSDYYRQVPLYIKCLDQGRLAALDRWLHCTVTTIDRFHCTSNVWTRGGWLL